ncbi:uncharacterized protein BO97DRAFT_252877 [Aspergillus homomorphus CBS 101889]|uniref:Secreted protein n=1 Tax=Aspergillus homomorphus (strain CBS 101889) TaxID=1450537 RepID=A0A395HI17_ASPHC|nr:hypothetical protein BO97DRAFT_252877 [Aspergillus homomorphus CBS 101889]RAL07390.1 hypothetical protein BO97DRAFT_252877 [Aspergillus homomorphus CBS 101889]
MRVLDTHNRLPCLPLVSLSLLLFWDVDWCRCMSLASLGHLFLSDDLELDAAAPREVQAGTRREKGILRMPSTIFEYGFIRSYHGYHRNLSVGTLPSCVSSLDWIQ